MSCDKWTASVATVESKTRAAAVDGSTDLSAGVEPLFAAATHPGLSPSPALKGSQRSFPPREPVLRSLDPVWGEERGC